MAADSIGSNGDHQRFGEFIVTLEEDTIEVRLGDKKDTIWMVKLSEVEGALKLLKKRSQS